MADPKSPSKCTYASIGTSKYIPININDGSAQWLLPINGILTQMMVWVESVGFIRSTDLEVEMWTNHNGGRKSADRISNISHLAIKWWSQIAVYPGVVAYRWLSKKPSSSSYHRSSSSSSSCWLLEKRRYTVLRMKIFTHTGGYF